VTFLNCSKSPYGFLRIARLTFPKRSSPSQQASPRCLHRCLHWCQTRELKYFEIFPGFRVFPPLPLFFCSTQPRTLLTHSTCSFPLHTYSSLVHSSTLQASCLRQQLHHPHRPPRSLVQALLRSLNHRLPAPMVTALPAMLVTALRLLVARMMVRVPRSFPVTCFDTLSLFLYPNCFLRVFESFPSFCTFSNHLIAFIHSLSPGTKRIPSSLHHHKPRPSHPHMTVSHVTLLRVHQTWPSHPSYFTKLFLFCLVITILFIKISPRASAT